MSLWERLGSHSDAEWRRGDLTAAQDPDRYAELYENSDTPLRLIGVKVELSSLNSVIESLPVNWMSAKNALDHLVNATGAYPLTCTKTLTMRAEAGMVATRAKLLRMEVAQTEGTIDEKHFVELPKLFWEAIIQKAIVQNWAVGDFSTLMNKRTTHAQAFGVEFSRADVESMGDVNLANNESSQDIDKDTKLPSRGGRKPANWWPGFAEELAVYIHDNGIPPGSGADGQSQIITAIQTLLSEAGKEEASRTSIQPVVTAVLTRMRSAGN